MVIIDVVLFLILIVSIIAFSPAGKILLEYFLGINNDQNVRDLAQKYLMLEEKVKEQEEELKNLRESYIFYDDKLKKLESSNQITKKIDINKHQNIG